VSHSPEIREGVRRAYGAAAERPGGEHPFPVGRRFAESVGYPGAVLDRLPAVSVDAFAGVSNVAIRADIPPGATVVDVGCGSGLDALLAAEKAGAGGRVIGVDFSSSMLDRARRGVGQAGAANVELRHGDAERLPLEDASVDVALVNGIFNLNPARGAIFDELARIVRPGGLVFAAELILRGPAAQPRGADDDASWFA